MKLFGYWRSSATYRIRIILALKDIAYEYTPVNLLEGAQKSDAHLSRNPQGLVPALMTDDGGVLTQSLAIAEYLEERFPTPALLPVDIEERARARAIAAAIACEGQPFMNLRIQKYLKQDHGFDADAMEEWLNRWSGGALRAVEQLLKPDTPFCTGDEPGFADAFLIPQVFGCQRFGVDLSETPRIVEIFNRCNALAPFARAHPENQPDAAGR